MKENYIITREQLEQIFNLSNLFAIHSEEVQNICESDRDDIKWLAFQLGKLHTDLRKDFISTMDLEHSIKAINK